MSRERLFSFSSVGMFFAILAASVVIFVPNMRYMTTSYLGFFVVIASIFLILTTITVIVEPKSRTLWNYAIIGFTAIMALMAAWHVLERI